MTIKPLIFDIIHGSFVNGPGIRTVIFMKGCQLRCVWCQNPESQNIKPETIYYRDKCINCGNCRSGCYSMARLKVGQYISPEELVKIILRDRVFYQSSSGGVTFTGGEPLLFIDYLSSVCKLLKRENIHIAVETCGYFQFEEFKDKLSSLIDLFLYDIKIVDPAQHIKYTGKSNDIILDNFKKLIGLGIDIVPRIPLIPDYTATKENLSLIAELFRSYKIHKYSFLPYNPSGIDKMKRLNREPEKELRIKPMTIDEERNWIEFFSNRINNISGQYINTGSITWFK